MPDAPDTHADAPRWLRRLGVTGRRYRRGWNRRRTTDVMRTLAWTLPLTLLLWVWAQDQQIEEATVQNVRVRLEHSDPRMALSLLAGPERARSAGEASLWATLALRGPRSGLDASVGPLREGNGGPLVIAVDPERAERISIDLRAAMADLPVLVAGGVTLASVTPPTAEVSVEPVAEAPATVVAGGDLPPGEIVGEAAFDPPAVTVSGPEPVLRALRRVAGPEGVRAVARLPRDLPAGASERSAEVELPADVRARLVAVVGEPQARRLRLEPPRVGARVDRRDRQLADYVAPAVTIWVDKPAALEGRASVRIDGPPVLNNVSVRGPASAVAAVRADPSLLRARLPLDGEDRLRVGERIEREAVWVAPPEVEVLDPPPTLAFELVGE